MTVPTDSVPSDLGTSTEAPMANMAAVGAAPGGGGGGGGGAVYAGGGGGGA